jgi:hypothetical protein
MNAYDILTRIQKVSKSKRPLCHAIAMVVNDEPVLVRELPVFWTKTQACKAARELSRLAGKRFITVDAYVKTK